MGAWWGGCSGSLANPSTQQWELTQGIQGSSEGTVARVCTGLDLAGGGGGARWVQMSPISSEPGHPSPSPVALNHTHTKQERNKTLNKLRVAGRRG